MSDSCDPMDCSTPGFPVLNDLPEFAQRHGGFQRKLRSVISSCRSLPSSFPIPEEKCSEGKIQTYSLAFGSHESCQNDPVLQAGRWDRLVHDSLQSWGNESREKGLASGHDGGDGLDSGLGRIRFPSDSNKSGSEEDNACRPESDTVLQALSRKSPGHAFLLVRFSNSSHYQVGQG